VLILFVADLFHPVNNLAVELFLYGNVRHGRCRRGAMPVLLAGARTRPVCGQYWIWQWSTARGSRGERYFGRVCHSQIAEAGGESALTFGVFPHLSCFGLTGSTRVRSISRDNRIGVHHLKCGAVFYAALRQE
jgi:hypothetical protein